MIVIVFAFVLVAASYVSAEIPSYIHVCSRSDPKIEQCIIKNLDNLKYKICDGLPELDVQPTNPFILDKLIISDNPNSKISMKNVKVSGFCDFDIKFLRLDLDKLHFDVDILFRQIQMNSTIDFNVRLLVPIAHTGQVYVTSNNIDAKVHMDMKTVTNNGKKYVYMSKMKINLNIKGYDRYGLENQDSNRVMQLVNNFIGQNQEEVISALKPAIEEIVVKRVLSLSNNIVKHFTFEELFPA